MAQFGSPRVQMNCVRHENASKRWLVTIEKRREQNKNIQGGEEDHIPDVEKCEQASASWRRMSLTEAVEHFLQPHQRPFFQGRNLKPFLNLFGPILGEVRV